MKSRNKIKYLYLAIIIILVIASSYPIYKYYDIFHGNGLSNKNQDWANAGSFFGGIYSSLFSFISIIVLCITLILTKRYNNQQLELLLTSQKKADFCSLFDKLNQKMNSINYNEFGLADENSYFERCEKELFSDLSTIKKREETTDPGTILDLSFNLLTGEWHTTVKPYYDVLLIAAEILNMLDEASEKIKSFYFAYMEANASTCRLYWLFCYMYGLDAKYQTILINNTRALRIPKGYI